MGLVKVIKSSLDSVMADQWREYFYCEALPMDTLVKKGQKRVSSRSGNVNGPDNIISNGSIISVADGQCMIIVEQGKVVEINADPGEVVYDASTEPTIFAGNLAKNIPDVLKNIGKRFTFAGEPPKDQRIYYFNTKELMGNKYGTPSPVPFRVVDKNIGLDIDVAIRCFGEYSYVIENPILFYTNVCANIKDEYKRSEIEGQLKSELLTALQPAFAKISEMGIRYSALPGHTMEMSEALKEILSEKWQKIRGISIVSFGVSSVKASEEDEQMIKEVQRNAVFRDPSMGAAHLVGAQASAMQMAASNESTGPMMAFAGMNMATGAGGMNAQGLYAMGQQQAQQQQAQQQQMQQQAAPQPAPAAAPQASPTGDTWTCTCGAQVSGNFCMECGAKRPEAPAGWTCSCGAVNKGKFCSECGAKKPEGVPRYKCDKCGWEPADPKNPPKFCPECGDPFDDGDIVK